MAVVKVLELLAESPTGFDDAVKQAVADASQTVRDIRSVWVKEFQATVQNDQIDKFRVNVKISFLVERT